MGDTRICSATSTGDYNFYHSDHLGSTSDVTDKNGNLIQHTEYTPYGEVYEPASTGNITEYLFTGKLLDSSTELYYFGARYYDPEIARFTQADTLIVYPNDPQDFNRYSYCRNNPINLVDPTGHSSLSKVFDKIGDFFEKNWEYVASAAIIVSTLFLATINPVAAAPFFYGEFIGAAVGGISAYQQGGDVGEGVLFGTVAGGVTGGLSMGFKDYMLNTAFANQFISPIQGGLITAGEFAIGGFGVGLIEGYAGGANDWDDAFRYAGISAGFGAALGFAAGYSYTAGWQDFLHGCDIRKHNLKIMFKKFKDFIVDLGNAIILPQDIQGIRLGEGAQRANMLYQESISKLEQRYGFGPLYGDKVIPEAIDLKTSINQDYRNRAWVTNRSIVERSRGYSQ